GDGDCTAIAASPIDLARASDGPGIWFAGIKNGWRGAQRKPLPELAAIETPKIELIATRADTDPDLWRAWSQFLPHLPGSASVLVTTGSGTTTSEEFFAGDNRPKSEQEIADEEI